MSANPGRRLAIVVATTEYDDSRLARLAAPLSDALELGRTLADQGGFDVESLVNAEAMTVQRRLERFAKAGREKADTLFVYLTGHGVKDVDGNLYFALRDTDRDLLRTTSLSAELLGAILNESPAGAQVLMLDCCYSGAIARALRPKGEEEVDIGGTFGGGRGRVILAASGAIEQAWEGERGSLYTHAVVEGIQTGAADLDRDGKITAGDLHQYAADRLRAEGRQTPRKFEFDDAGKLVIARPGNRAAAPAPVSAPKQPAPAPPVEKERTVSVPDSTPAAKPPRRRGAPAWIPGMVAVALAAILTTLWLTGAIGFLPSPLGTTTTLAAPPTTTTAAVATTAPVIATTVTQGQSNTTVGVSTTVGSSTTTTAAVNLVAVFEDDFSTNDRGWADGGFSDDNGTYFFQFLNGAYEAGYSIADPTSQTYYSAVPFSPGDVVYYVETEMTSLVATSQCGLALQTQNGTFLAVALGASEVRARLYTNSGLAEEGFWDVAVDEPAANEIGLWVDGASITVYVDDIEIGQFEEPRIAGVNGIGVSIMGGAESNCSFDYLTLWTG
ncbi:MAG TPA: caspase family protein [Acidimicrobiia bacterium]|jgi:hypothetical protein